MRAARPTASSASGPICTRGLVPKDKPADVRDSLLRECARAAQAWHHQRDRSRLVGGAGCRRLVRRVGTSVPEARRRVAARVGSGRLSLARKARRKLGAMKLKEFGKKTGDGNDACASARSARWPPTADSPVRRPGRWWITRDSPDFAAGPSSRPNRSTPNIEEGHKLGWQFGIHAIGDAAIAMTVDALDKVLHDYPRNDHRHYLVPLHRAAARAHHGNHGEG